MANTKAAIARKTSVKKTTVRKATARKAASKKVVVVKATATSSRVDNALDLVKDVNQFAFNTAEVLLEKSLERSTEWQVLTEKTLHTAMKVSEKQQDVVFKTLESFKGQFLKGRQRAIGLIK